MFHCFSPTQWGKVDFKLIQPVIQMIRFDKYTDVIDTYKKVLFVLF